MLSLLGRRYLLAGLIFLISCKVKPHKVISKYPDGKIQSITTYPNKNDTSTCDIKIYNPDGKLNIVLLMLNGKYVDKKIIFYDNGNVKEIDSLTEPCDTNQRACNGMFSRYYENGKIALQYSRVNEKICGLTRRFDSSGRLINLYVLKNDSIFDGEYKEFYDNGNISYSANYKNDTTIGFSYFFGRNGDTLRYYNNYRGQKSFPHKDFFENGNSVFGDYTDSTYSRVTWIWYGKDGKELKRKTVKPNRNDGFVTPDH